MAGIFVFFLLLAGVSAQESRSGPGPHFQGSGKTTLAFGATEYYEGCGYIQPGPEGPSPGFQWYHDLFLVIEETSEGLLARVALDCPEYLGYAAFPITAPFVATGSTYLLEGDWSTGFIGHPIARCLECFLEIGPYSGGSNIPVHGNVFEMAGSWFEYWGTVSDLDLV